MSRSTVADRQHGAAPARPLAPFVIVGLVAIVVIVGVVFLGGSVTGLFDSSADSVVSATDG